MISKVLLFKYFLIEIDMIDFDVIIDVMLLYVNYLPVVCALHVL